MGLINGRLFTREFWPPTSTPKTKCFILSRMAEQLLRGRYRIDSELGKGGMGTVYLGYDTSLDTKVAIKTNHTPGSDSTRQFLREAKLLANMRHPNLPRVTDYFVEGDVQYLVMDYIPGDDLSTRMKRNEKFTVEQALSLTEQLGGALSYLHQQNPPIIHRDVKPANIKITPQGQPLLVDFGIAKSTESAQTTTGARGYTPGYAPPEQYGGLGTGTYSDQYALAATLYALLTGQSPAESVERMLGHTELKPARALNPKVPEHVDNAIQRGLALQSDERFGSVVAFIAALKDPHFKAGETAAKTVYSGATMRPASQAATIAAETQVKKPRRWLWAVAGVGGIGVIGVVFLLGVFASGNNNGGEVPGGNGGSPVVISGSTGTPTLPLVASETSGPVVPTDTLEPSATLPPPTPIGSGGLIAFVSNRTDGRTFQIFTMKPDGSEVTQLTFDLASKSQPVWSPDGTKLLYVADGGTLFGTDLGLDVWMINADGNDLVNLTKSVGDDTDPAWAPDGSLIAFVSERVGGVRQIYFMHPDGSNPQFITRGYAVEYQPAWSPDMSWLGFSISINDAPAQFWLRTGIGADPRPFDVQLRLTNIADPEWSPDGTMVAYTQIDVGQFEIYIALFADKGNTLYPLTNTLGNKEPAWSPDGKWIVFTSTRDQNSEIYVMDAAGRLQTNLTNQSSTDMQPDWQPVVSP